MSVTIPPAGEYRIEPGESKVSFRTTHMFGLGKVHGTFAITGGQITVAEPVTGSSAAAEVDAGSFATDKPKRDEKIRSAKYLNTAEHPAIGFQAGKVRQDGEQWLLEGTLTVREKPVPVAVRIEEATVDGDRLRARASTTVDRYEFGITVDKGMTGRRLDLTLDVAATRS